MIENGVTIYALTDPRDGRVRYVGKTWHPRRRRNRHCSIRVNRTDNLPVSRWANKLNAMGLAPLWTVLEVVPGDCWVEAERRWIAHYRLLIDDLLNLCDGGEGGTSPKSPLHRRKLAAANRGKKHTEESRRKMSLSRMGNTCSVGRKLPQWHKSALLARGRSPEVVQKAADSLRAKIVKEWVVTTPTGEELRIRNLHQFCKDRGLNTANMCRLAAGLDGRTQHKGYKVRHADTS